MQIPKWIKSVSTLLDASDRRFCLSTVTLSAAIASLSAQAASAQQPTKGHKSDIQYPTDSGFTKQNEKFILTAADSFVVTAKGDTLRFKRQGSDALPAPASGRAPAGHSSHASHASHASHSSHSSHRSGGWV